MSETESVLPRHYRNNHKVGMSGSLLALKLLIIRASNDVIDSMTVLVCFGFMELKMINLVAKQRVFLH